MGAGESRLRGGLRIGRGYFEGAGLHAGPAVAGLVDDVTQLSRPGVDASTMHPSVRPFFEQTSALEFVAVPRFGAFFKVLFALYRVVAVLMGQLCNPLHESRVRCAVRPIDEARDGRRGARACVRWYEPSGAVMQAAAYGLHTEGDTTFMSVAFPLPFSCLTGLLRLDLLPSGPGGNAASLSSEPRGDGAGVFFSLGPLSLRMPLGETMTLYEPDSPALPDFVDRYHVPHATIISVHEQRLFGRRFVRFTYYFSPISPERTP